MTDEERRALVADLVFEVMASGCPTLRMARVRLCDALKASLPVLPAR